MMDLFGKDDSASNHQRFLQKLEALEREIPSPADPRVDLAPAAAVKVRERVQTIIQKLSSFSRAIDPVKHYEVYDPSHPLSAADLIAERLLRQPRVPLAGLERFYGAGIYALYYVGDHPAYQIITGAEIPIYVGKAEAADTHAHSSIEQGEKLYDRLAKDHARSIRAVEKHTCAAQTRDSLEEAGVHPLRLQDFECRFLVLASAYAGAVERNLISHYHPVWNKETRVCIGFGKHGDDAKRRANTRSDWDTIHPGRSWAIAEGNVPNPRTPKEIETRILEHSRRKYGPGKIARPAMMARAIDENSDPILL